MTGTMGVFVIFYVSLFSATGGGQHTMTLLAEQLVARGVRIALVTRPPLDRRHRYVTRIRRLGIPIVTLPRLGSSWLARCGEWGFALAVCVPYAMLRRRSLPAALLATRSIFATWLAALERRDIERRLDRLAGSAGPRVLLHVWGPAALTPLLLEWAGRRTIPAIYHEMGEADEAYVRAWDLAGTVASLPLASEVICCSASVASCVRSVYGYTGPLSCIPFMTEAPAKTDVPLRPSRVMFGAIGRLVPHKRHADLLVALRRLRDRGADVGLVIAGMGPLLEGLKRHAAELDLADRVVFTGEFEELSAVMGAFDVFVLTSSSESQCMPITESMAYGKAVIASRFGGIPDFVEDEVTGLLVPPGDLEALTAAMERLAKDPDLRAAMGAKGRARYRERYGSAPITAAVMDCYARSFAATVIRP